MSKPLVVSIPHRLGREEAARRIRTGFDQARNRYASVLTVTEEVWSGDRLAFRVTALGQSASGTIDVNEDYVQLEVTLPWLLAKLTERIAPMIRNEGTGLLEKK